MKIGNITTSAKYTVIVSTFRADLSHATNMHNHVKAGYSLALCGYNRVADVLGFYKEEGQAEGSTELSRAMPISSLRDVKELAYLFCVSYKQDCIMAVNNDSGDVWLVDGKGALIAKLGKWTVSKIQPDTQGWTFDGQFYYYAE